MTSLSKIIANRENAQLSTGPRTEEGKRRSSLNAVRHGLTGRTVVLPGEDALAYRNSVKSWYDEYQPKTTTEAQLVQTLADTAWRMNRIPAHQANLLAIGYNQSQVTCNDPEVEAALALADAYAK